MATNVVMPKLGLTMESGIIGSWLVSEGDSVEKGQPLLEVITDKVTMEVEAQETGVVRKIFFQDGSEVDVSKIIAVIADENEKIDDFLLQDSTELVEKENSPSLGAPNAPIKFVDDHTGDEVNYKRASPKARKIAASKNVDISLITGTGANGRVVSADVEDLLKETDSKSVTDTTLGNRIAERDVIKTDNSVDLLPAEKVASQRLTMSYQQTPHIHLSLDVSGIWLEQLRKGYKLEGKQISYNSLIVRGIALALEEFPRVNSHFCEGGFLPQKEIDIGLAVAADSGLIVPVIRSANRLTIDELAVESNRLIDSARNGRLSIDDCVGGSFTISNLGMLGISQFTAIINPPQVAIMAIGAIEKKVVPIGEDGFGLRSQFTLTLGADHRVLDGAISARFLSRVKKIIETPGLLA